MARIAKSLDVLRSQINLKYPGRSKVSDGWIASATHSAQNPTSDHEPNGAGIVTALDITHDPAHGVDTWKLAETLRQKRDGRIKYVISNGRIFSSTISPWQWRPYDGANKHAHHIHISVASDQRQFDSGTSWDLGDVIPISSPPVVAPPKGITPDMRRRMAKAIVDSEARRVNGKIVVYNPPGNDGGGAYEVAGINVKYHPEQAAKLKALVEAGKDAEAEAAIISYILQYTNAASGWTTDAGPEFYLRDTIFNRGPTGAARILQMAIGVPVDGQVGPQSRAVIATITPGQLLTNLRSARERYEREVAGYRANLWAGLTNRWNNALKTAQAFQKEQAGGGGIIKDIIVTTGVVVGGGGGTAAVVKQDPWTWTEIGMAAFSAAVAVIVIVTIIRKIRSK